MKCVDFLKTNKEERIDKDKDDNVCSANFSR